MFYTRTLYITYLELHGDVCCLEFLFLAAANKIDDDLGLVGESKSVSCQRILSHDQLIKNSSGGERTETVNEEGH